MKAEVVSETGAMHDVYKSKDKNINSYLEAFECLEGQKGILVFIDGEVVGKVIHTAFFRASKSEKVGDMSSAARRRGFRTGF
jgi:hypothetical protein